jgi:hypothetical protein
MFHHFSTLSAECDFRRRNMLRASDVMAAGADHLEREEGYQIPTQWPPSLGVIATHPQRGTLLLYAVGEDFIPPLDSKRPHVTRVMDEQEVLACIAAMFHKAVSEQYREPCSGRSVALIFPDNDSFQQALIGWREGSNRLGIKVLLVRGGGKSVVGL